MGLSIQDWGAIGELTGAILLFLSLVYIGFQIQPTRKMMFASAAQARSEILIKGDNDPLSLNELELFRYRVLLNNIFLSYWHIYTQPEELHDELWATQQGSLIRLIASHGKFWWNSGFHHCDGFNITLMGARIFEP